MLILKRMTDIHHGETLKRVLKEQGRTIKWLADQLTGVDGRESVSPQSVSGMMKSRRIRQDRLEEINKILGIDLHTIAIRASRSAPGSSVLKLTVVKDDEQLDQSPRTKDFLDKLEDLLRAFDGLTADEKKQFLGKK